MSSDASSFLPDDSSGPSINENWASPSELLEMRTMWSAIVTQHSAEMTAMQAALERSHQQQQHYLKELQETHRLRHLYTAAAADQERIVEERKVWAEEKVLMQQEIQRLKLAAARQGQTAGREGTAASDTTTATSWSGTPSVPSSYGSDSSRSAVVAAAQAENVALHEALARLSRERAEIDQRLQFVTTASAMQQRSLQTRTETQAADIARLEKRVEAHIADAHRLATEGAALRSERDALEANVARLEKVLKMQEETAAKEKSAATAELAARVEETTERLENAHAAEVAALQRQLAEANCARESLRERVESSAAQATASAHTAQRRIDELEGAVAALRQNLRRIEDESLTVSRAHQQVQCEMLDRIRRGAEALEDATALRVTLQMRVDGLEGRLVVADAESERMGTETEHLRAQVSLLMSEVQRSRDAEEALGTARATVAELVSELATQRDFYEAEAARHAKAMELMQHEHSEEKRRLFELIGPRPAAGKTKTKKGQEGDAAHTSRAAPQNNNAATDKSKRDKGRKDGVVVDALQLMKINASMAERCALSIAKV